MWWNYRSNKKFFNKKTFQLKNTSTKSVPTKTIPANSTSTNFYILPDFLLIAIALFVALYC